jgi:plasmid stabilization system protein ParE
MNSRIRVLRRAILDVESILSWLGVQSNEGARRWYRAFYRATGRISQNPLLFGPAIEFTDLDPSIRQAVFRTRRGAGYRIIYRIVAAEVQILRVRGPGQPLLGPDELEDSLGG